MVFKLPGVNQNTKWPRDGGNNLACGLVDLSKDTLGATSPEAVFYSHTVDPGNRDCTVFKGRHRHSMEA